MEMEKEKRPRLSRGREYINVILQRNNEYFISLQAFQKWGKLEILTLKNSIYKNGKKTLMTTKFQFHGNQFVFLFYFSKHWLIHIAMEKERV